MFNCRLTESQYLNLATAACVYQQEQGRQVGFSTSTNWRITPWKLWLKSSLKQHGFLWIGRFGLFITNSLMWTLTKDSKLVESVTSKFNNLLVFDAESPVMCYTLRDPISVGTYPSPSELKPRGKARNIVVKSKCFDACLVIDGSLSFKFNDGTKAVIELLDEDSLRTVQLFQDL